MWLVQKPELTPEPLIWVLSQCFDLLLLSRVRLFATPQIATYQAFLSFIISRSLSKLMSTESVMLSKHLTLCCLLVLLPSIFPSIRVFSNESALQNRWPKDWSFSFSSSLSNKYSGLIFFRMDWLDLLAVQGHRRYHPILLSLLLASSFCGLLVKSSVCSG